MTDRKITGLDAITGASVDVDNDLLEIVDVSESSAIRKNKRITPRALVASTSSFLQSGTAAVSRTVQEKIRDGEVSIKDFGAACDGTTDDTTAFQAAIDAIGSTALTRRSGMTLLVPGPTIISSTITAQQKSFTLRGNGWGTLDDSNGRASYIRWNGAAGSPMLKIINCNGGVVIRDIAFKGKTTAKPSSAIELNQQASIANGPHLIENVTVGSSLTGDDPGVQFTNGIVSTGINSNNAENRFSHIRIYGCSDTGLRQGYQQNGNWVVDNIDISGCAVGVQCVSTMAGSCWNFSLNDVDMKFPLLDDGGNGAGPRLIIQRYHSELSGRMFDGTTVTLDLTILQGEFGLSANLNADGKIGFQTASNSNIRLVLRDFLFQTISSPPTPPFFQFEGSPGGGTPRQLIFDGIRGWSLLTGGTNGLDITTQTQVDGAYVYLLTYETSQTGFKNKISRNFLNGKTGREFDITRYEQPYNAPSVRLYDDFLGDVLADEWNCRLGTDPQCVTATITANVGGMVRMVTGDDAAADIATNGVQLDSALNWQANAGGLTCEFRIKISAITNVAVFVGLTDQVAALEMPFTLAAGDALTSNATDAVGILFDTAADTDRWWLVGVANNADATKQDSALAPVADTYEKWRIEVSSQGHAKFWRNGVVVGTQLSSSTRVNIPLTPVIAAFSRAAASRNIDADKIYVEQDE